MLIFYVLAQDCSNSIANALESLQSCAKPLIYVSVDRVIIGPCNGWRYITSQNLCTLCFANVVLVYVMFSRNRSCGFLFQNDFSPLSNPDVSSCVRRYLSLPSYQLDLLNYCLLFIFRWNLFQLNENDAPQCANYVHQTRSVKRLPL